VRIEKFTYWVTVRFNAPGASSSLAAFHCCVSLPSLLVFVNTIGGCLASSDPAAFINIRPFSRLRSWLDL
jgi:hypothetical protein